MKAGSFNINDYLNKLHEEAEGNTDKGFTTDVEGLVLPEDTKRNFDWLNKEYQKGKVEVKVEIKGEGSSFKPGYDLQTDLKSVKDFKPGMYGEVKTGDTGKSQEGPSGKTKTPSSPNNKKEDVEAEEKDPKGGKEAADNQDKKAETSPKKQSLKLDTTKNTDKKKKDAE